MMKNLYSARVRGQRRRHKSRSTAGTHAVLAERNNHYQILTELKIFLPEEWQKTYVIMDDPNRDWRSLFPHSGTDDIVVCTANRNPRIRTLRFYFEILRNRRRADTLYFTTGPEGHSIIEVFISVVCMRRYAGSVLSIRNVDYYKKNSERRILGKSVKWILSSSKLIILESKTQEREFALAFPDFAHKTTHVYVSFPPPRSRPVSDTWSASGREDLRIGLLGMVTPDRRDYESVLHALKSLSKIEKSRITIVVLGATVDPRAHSIIEEISKECKVLNCEPGAWLDSDSFIELGESCQVLLSPLRNDLGYGSHKGTGAFGDALKLRKPMLIPEFADPLREFEDFVQTYSSPEELTALVRYWQTEIRNGQFDRRDFGRFERDVLAEDFLRRYSA